MTINFALSLSFEGIRLLHRVSGGWQVAGEVALDTPNLAQSMSELRETAQTLSPSGVRTKVLLPQKSAAATQKCLKYRRTKVPPHKKIDRRGALHS